MSGFFNSLMVGMGAYVFDSVSVIFRIFLSIWGPGGLGFGRCSSSLFSLSCVIYCIGGI